MNTLPVRIVCFALLIINHAESAEYLARKWTDTTGTFTIDAEFIDLIDDYVRLRRIDGQALRVPLTKLSEADKQYVRSLSSSTAQSANPFTTQAEPETATTISIVASGTGRDEASALKQAFVNAIQQAVGTIVDAETVVANDEIIREQILTASNAIVTRYDPLGKPSTDNGLVTVRIKALVERRALMDRLSKADIIKRPVEGRDLFAQLETEALRETEKLAMIRRVFQGFPLNVLRVEHVGDLTPVRARHEGEDPSVIVQVQLAIDQDKYDAWRAAAQPVLAKMATRTAAIRFDLRNAGLETISALEARARSSSSSTIGRDDNMYTYQNIQEHFARYGVAVPDRTFGRSYIGRWLDLGTRSGEGQFLVVFEALANNMKGALLAFDEATIAEVWKSVACGIIIDAALKDNQGREVSGNRFYGCIRTDVHNPILSTSPVWVRHSEWNRVDFFGLPRAKYSYNGIIILPGMGIWDDSSWENSRMLGFFPAITKSLEIVVPQERIKDIRSVNVELLSISLDANGR